MHLQNLGGEQSITAICHLAGALDYIWTRAMKYSIDSDAISAAKVGLWYFVLFCFRRKEKIVCLDIKREKKWLEHGE